MPSDNKYLQEFLQKVCQEIRFKSLHGVISKELSDHIADQQHAYVQQGLDAEAAAVKAVAEMGDPVMVGKQYDLAHRPKTEWSILTMAAVLVLAGGIIQYMFSGVNAQSAGMFTRYLQYAPLSLLAFALMYFGDYMLLARHARPVYLTILAAALLGFCFLPRSHGAYTYAYYAALLLIPAYAGIVYGFKDRGYAGIVYSGLYYLGGALLCIAAPSAAAFLLLTISCLVMLSVGVAKGWFGGDQKAGLAMVLAPVLLVSALGLLSAPAYVVRRISYFFNPTLDPLGPGYLPLMVRRLCDTASPWGAVMPGSGDSGPVVNLLPNWATDFSFTYIIAKMGYLPGMLLAAAMFGLIARMFITVFRQKNACGFLVALAACLAITGQIVFYLLSNLGVIAPLAMTLPFISYGALGFVVNMALLGLLLSVYRRSDLVIDRLPANYGGGRFITYADGKLIIDLGWQFNKARSE